MLVRRPVLREHIVPLIGLTVRADQAGLVSSNVKTLAQAAYEPGAYVWGLWYEAVPVGLMAMIHPGEAHKADDPLRQQPDDPTAAYLWRLMIGADFQGSGYGSAALAMAFFQARDWGFSRLTAHVADTPHSNLGFYKRFGFRDTGLIEYDERVIIADI
jgi:diamine N-acetyltransferase